MDYIGNCRDKLWVYRVENIVKTLVGYTSVLYSHQPSQPGFMITKLKLLSTADVQKGRVNHAAG